MECMDQPESSYFETTMTPEEEWEAISDNIDGGMEPPAYTDGGFNAQGSEADPSVLNFLAETPLTAIVASDITDLVSSIFLIIEPHPSVLLRGADFINDGNYDPTNECIVHGDVVQDIEYIDAQSGPTCSLMAQEQFVERYIRQDVPEDVLAWRAETWGYYQPDGLDAGTNWIGQTAVLEHFDIPHSREVFASVDDLNGSLKAGNDVLIGVDARGFYDDPSLPPGSGHAVAIVGWGADPDSGRLCGYYITDSNFPGTVRFISRQTLEQSWYRDMISVASAA